MLLKIIIFLIKAEIIPETQYSIDDYESGKKILFFLKNIYDV